MSARRARGRARAVARLAAWAALALAPAALAVDGGMRLWDGGSPSAATAALSAEDREVVDNLELLENLDASSDLDLLLELSSGADDAGD